MRFRAPSIAQYTEIPQVNSQRSILILGASYGSLLASRILLAGHNVTLVCLPAEAELINSDGIRVRMPTKGRANLVEINSKTLDGKLSASSPAAVDPAAFDLIVLAMQEPQYRAKDVRELLGRAAKAMTPMMSIMNMPPLPFMLRLPGIAKADIARCYADASVWEPIDPALMTLCSPDPQAFRPVDEPLNVLQVSLPTNFKAARFANPAHTAILTQLAADIEASRLDYGDGPIELPVKLKVHDSLFVPMAKWAMLLTGNYRCIGGDAMRPIRDAVHADFERSRAVYTAVNALCRALGANADDLVPFEKYANAARGLAKPSSAARALAAGARAIERVDLLVQTLARKASRPIPAVDEVVTNVEGWLDRNRAKAA
jgi:hypothetical protein